MGHSLTLNRDLLFNLENGGMALPHGNPLAKLKCFSEKRRLELAGRPGEEGQHTPRIAASGLPSRVIWIPVREMKQRVYNHCLRLVEGARQRRIKSTA